jgi:carboxyl-terminal processing protease
MQRSTPSLLVFVALAMAGAASHAETLCSDVPSLQQQFLDAHIRFRTAEPVVWERTASTYLERMDSQRLLFLKPEAERQRAALIRAAREIKSGSCATLRRLHAELIARTRRMEDEVRAFVTSESYALDPNAELVIDPEERGWPLDDAERRRVLEASVHFQISNIEAGGETRDEARQRLVHRYELRTKRTQEVSYEELLSAWLDAFANSLDPHSNYYSADSFEDFKIQMQLSLEGIGVALQDREGSAVVQQIMPKSAAEKEGSLRKGDRIVEVSQADGEPVDIADMGLDDIVRLIRGPRGTKVKLTVYRDATPPERFQVEIVRAKIDLEEQAAKLRFEPATLDGRTLNLAVLTLPGFYGSSDPRGRLASRDVRRMLEEARRKQADGLLLDLAFNGGGLLDDAVRIAGFFILDGGVVAVREGYASRVMSDPEGGIGWVGPMVVLTSRFSASASEILAGALKDYRRAVVVGDEATFGKGTVQTMMELPGNRGALKVTTGMFFRPGGASTQNDGVRADVVLPSLLTADLVGESVEKNALESENVAPFISSTANAALGRARWQPVTDKIVSELSRRSALRVAQDPLFQEIKADLAERAGDQGKVKLATVIERRAEDEKKEALHKPKSDAAPAGKPAPAPPLAAAKPSAGAAGRGLTAAVGPTAPRENLGDDEEEEDARPDLDEALRVLADLVALQPQPS